MEQSIEGVMKDIETALGIIRLIRKPGNNQDGCLAGLALLQSQLVEVKLKLQKIKADETQAYDSLAIDIVTGKPTTSQPVIFASDAN